MEILSDGLIVKTKTDSSGLSWNGGEDIEADPKTKDGKAPKKVFRLYYTKENYVDSDQFTVTKDYAFLVNPLSAKVDYDSTDTGVTVSWRTNFDLKKIEIYSNNVLIDSYVDSSYYHLYTSYGEDYHFITADLDTAPEKKFIRAYYSKDKYIDSEEFTVTKKYEFLLQPIDVTIGLNSKDTASNVSWKVNFVPAKIELYSDDTLLESYTSSIGAETSRVIDADPNTKPGKKKIRAYYSANGYIDSDLFKVTKIYGFIAQPSSVKVDTDSKDDYATVSWKSNFVPKKVEIISDNSIIATSTSDTELTYEMDWDITTDPDNSAKKKVVRVYYDETGYADTDEFTITKHYHNIVKVDAKASTCKNKGNEEYYKCSLEGCTYIFKDKDGKEKLVKIPELDIVSTAHSWGETELTWADDLSSVTAKRVCTLDGTHTESEKVETEKTLKVDEKTGKRYNVYTAVFKNTAFGKQIKEVEAPLVIGDANNDGDVNAKDVTQLRRYLAGGWGVEIDEAACDVNGDGDVNAKDVTQLRRYLAGGWGVKLG
jgi:hypothetical protein